MSKRTSPDPSTPAPAPAPPPPVVIHHPLFKWIVLGDFLLILLFGIGMAWASSGDSPTQLQSRFYEDFRTGLLMTLGAFIGLIGGKAADVVRPPSP